MYARVARKYRWATIAWALMQNHHHFVIRLTDGGLSEGMRELHGGYSRWIHAMYGQTGRVTSFVTRSSDAASTTKPTSWRLRYVD